MFLEGVFCGAMKRWRGACFGGWVGGILWCQEEVHGRGLCLEGGVGGMLW